MKIILKDFKSSRWVSFDNPVTLLVAQHPVEVPDLLARCNNIISTHQYFVAGFLSYEAASGIDLSLTTNNIGNCPVAAIGVYRDYDILPDDYMDIPVSVDKLALEPSIAEAEYFQCIHKIKEYLESGDTYQVNYTFRMRGDSPGDSLSLFRLLYQQQPSDYAAFIETEHFSVVSVSPELFLRREGKSLHSKPMKGTHRRGRYSSEDHAMASELKASSKSQAENVMIVDMVRNDLGRIARTGTVQVSRLMDVEKYPTLWQMTSTVQCSTDATWKEILSATFPAASITGAPKKRTMELIAELESSPRNIYTGTIGYVDPFGDGCFSVAIRTALINRKDKTFEYGTGGGIVWDSDPEKEFEESVLKTKVLTSRRPDFDLLESIRLDEESCFYLLDYHLERMEQSAQYFDYPFDRQRILEVLMLIQQKHPKGCWKVRLLLSKKGNINQEVISIESRRSGTIRLRFGKLPVDSKDVFLFHKTTHRKIYENAKAMTEDCDDVILCNENGEVTETTVANIFIKKQGRWFTPKIQSGLLAGTYRRYAIEQGKVHECILNCRDIENAESIQLVNSVSLELPAVLINN